MKYFLMIAATVSVLATQIVLADESVPMAHSHKWTYYTEANIGPNLYYGPGGSSLTSGLQGYGYNINAGYSYSDVSSVEVGFMQNYATYEKDGDTHDGRITAPYAAFRFNTPISRQFSLFTKLGIMFAKVNLDEDTSFIPLPYTGIGLGYALTNNLDISIQYQGAVYVIAGAGLLSGGLSYHFG